MVLFAFPTPLLARPWHPPSPRAKPPCVGFRAAHACPAALARRRPLDTPQTTTAAPILMKTKPGQPPPQVTTAWRRAHSSNAAAESDFASTGGESHQFLPHSWIEDKWWFPLSQFNLTTAEPAVLLLAAAARQARIGTNTSPANFIPRSSQAFVGKNSNVVSHHSN